jgi:hypothetical protein
LSQGTNGGGRERNRGKRAEEKEQRKKSRGKEQKPGILQAEKMAVIMDSRK